jgi:hypothetical protein
MARTALTVTALSPNSSVADPAGNAVDVANGHVLTPTGEQCLEEFYLEVNQTFAGAKNITIKAGANPPALSAGQGDLVVSINAAIKLIGPFTSARFAQADGSLYVDLEAGTTGTIKAIHVPRTA